MGKPGPASSANTHKSAIPRATRGSGLLEPLLARLRARQANLLIPNRLRHGRLLDIGCGSFPYFLSHTFFEEKFAIDQLAQPPSVSNIAWYTLDLNAEPHLPFDNSFLSVVTMLAVTEHLDPSNLVCLFREAYRVLHSGGLLVITTPAAWSDGLLRWMAHFHLVSADEIKEHVYAYTLPLLGWYFGNAGFEMGKVRFGYFECVLNLWATAER